MRRREGLTLERRRGHKPEVDDMRDDEAKRILAMGYEGLTAGIRDGAHRHEDQEEDGVDAEFLYPGFFGLFSFENTELLVACQRNYNDWLHDYATASNGRLYGLAAIPIQDPEAAVAELDRVIKRGFKGGCIPCSAPPDAPYKDLCYEPVWARAEEANFPLAMHVGTNAYIPPQYRQKSPLPRRRDGRLRRIAADHPAHARGPHVPRRRGTPSQAQVRGGPSSTPAGSATGWTAWTRGSSASIASAARTSAASARTRSGGGSSTPPSRMIGRRC